MIDQDLQYNYQSPMPLLEIFRKDRRHWTEAEIQEVQLFFTLHPFFSRFYEHQDFDKVVAITFYTRLQHGEECRLELNKKSEIVILLAGEVTLYRKVVEGEGKKKSKKEVEILHGQYVKVSAFRGANELIETKSDVILRANHDHPAEFLFVPSMLYEAHSRAVSARKLQRIVQVLETVFAQADKRDLKILAESGCIFRELRMNSYIYHAGETPEYCYILASGNVKIEAPGFSARKMMDMSIIGENTVFGERDLNEETRTQNAICCSAHCRVLALRKEAYNRFISRNRHLIHPLKLRPRASQVMAEKDPDRHVLPRILRFHSSRRPEEEDKIQKGLLQNCHMLINLSPERRASSSFRLPVRKDQRDYSISQFDRKLSLFKRIKSTRPPDQPLRLI